MVIKEGTGIPLNHTCNMCGTTRRDGANFKLQKGKYLLLTCNSCVYRRDRHPDDLVGRGNNGVGRVAAIGTTYHYDKIPEGHTCVCCGKDKSEVNFRVNVLKRDVFRTERWCNGCRKHRKGTSITFKNNQYMTKKDPIIRQPRIIDLEARKFRRSVIRKSFRIYFYGDLDD